MVRDRDWSEEDARSRVAAQASREDRLAIATYVVENTGTREELRARVEQVWADLHRLSRGRRRTRRSRSTWGRCAAASR